MQLIDSSQDKVKKICDILVKETLEPARKEKEKLLEEARAEADEIIKRAHEKAAQIKDETQKKLNERQRVFDSSLKVAAQKAITMLRDKIETKLFHPQLDQQIKDALSDQALIVKLIDAIASTMGSDLEVIISNQFKPEEVAATIADASRKKLKGESIDVGVDGVVVKCEKEHFSVEITEKTVKELVLRYAQDNLRMLLFNEEL